MIVAVCAQEPEQFSHTPNFKLFHYGQCVTAFGYQFPLQQAQRMSCSCDIAGSDQAGAAVAAIEDAANTEDEEEEVEEDEDDDEEAVDAALDVSLFAT